MADNKKITVLIADDEPSTLALLSRHLRSKGYSVLEASDGDQAWELAHQHLPHLVLLDVMMPGMSGWEVCRKIREAVSLAHTGVIMLTGIGELLNEMTSPLYGADAYVDKPFEFADLDRKIEETLERRSKGTMGRPDHAEEQNGSVAMQPEPIAASEPPLAKPPVKARPKAEAAAAPAKSKPAPAKAQRKAAKEPAVAETRGDNDKPSTLAKVAKAAKSIAKKALSTLEPSKPAAKPAKATEPTAPVKAAKSAKVAKAAKKAAKPAKAAKKAAKPAKAAKKAAKPAKAAKKAAKPAKAAKKAAKPAKKAAKKAAKPAKKAAKKAAKPAKKAGKSKAKAKR